MKLKVADIIVEDRKRDLDKKKVLLIADSMKEIGQLHSIKVTPDMILRAGLHRLEAAKYLGWEEIEGDIVDLDPLRQELVEIDENLMRAELHYLERGEFLRRRKEIYEILYPEARKGGDRKSEEFKARVIKEPLKPGFARDAADKMGVTARSIHQDLQIAEKLAPEIKPVVRQTNLPKADILHLIRTHKPKQQVAIIGRVTDGQASTIHEAEKQIATEETIKRGRGTEVEADLKLGTAAELFPGVGSESIKLVLSSLLFSDGIDMAFLLAESERVLMPGGILALAMIQPDIEKLCRLPRPESLKLLWIVADTLNPAEHDKRPEGLRSGWMPIVLFIKGEWESKISSDLIQRSIGQLRKGEDSMVQLISRFSSVGDPVLDPFCTTKFESYLAASTGRKYSGFFISQADIDFAKSRIKEVADAIAFA